MLSKKQQTVYKFLNKHNIRSGEIRTPLYVLYRHYVFYCRRADFPIVSPIEFGRRMSKYFQKGKSGRYAYYFTNLKVPTGYEKKKIRMWYDRNWSRMRNGEEA